MLAAPWSPRTMASAMRMRYISEEAGVPYCLRRQRCQCGTRMSYVMSKVIPGAIMSLIQINRFVSRFLIANRFDSTGFVCNHFDPT
jgi:hypothetical protein